MKKPSIFSKDYERIMKNRKRKKILAIFTFTFIGLISLIVIGSYYINNNLTVRKFIINMINREDINADNEIPVINEENNILEVILKNNLKLKIKVVKNGDDKKIEEVNNKNDILSCWISNDKKYVLIIDNNKNMYIVNSNGDISDFTLKEYIAPNGEVFKREEV